ncbi:MAG: hypothetical protein OHK0023_09480 [Anaerolineae bacterium]
MAMFGIVQSDLLNFRERPTTEATILRVLQRGDGVRFIRDAGFDWFEVETLDTGLRGFVSRIFLQMTDQRPQTSSASNSSGTPNPSESEAPKTTATPNIPKPRVDPELTASVATGVATGTRVEVNTRILNVRRGPGTQHDIVGQAQLGQKFDVLGRQGDWLRIAFNGQDAFISATFVKPASTGFTLEGFLVEEPELLEVRPQPNKLIPPQPNGTTEAAVARTWNVYGGLLGRLSDLLNIPVDVVVGVLVAESGGAAFGPDGRMIIRFENHIFFNLWGRRNEAIFNQFFTFDRTSAARGFRGHQWRPDVNQAFRDFHGNQASEWEVLTFARQLDDTAALQSISMGAPQIMGFNFRRLGYESVQQMFERFNTSLHAQIIGIFDFVKGSGASSQATEALQRRDYVTFASIYNGPANATIYSDRIRRFAGLFQKLITTAS